MSSKHSSSLSCISSLQTKTLSRTSTLHRNLNFHSQTTMAFVTRIVPARSLMTGASFQAYRSFSTTLATQRGPVEATKDVLKKADRTVSDAAVKGIETGETLTQKAQETIGVKSKEAEGKAKELAGEAKGKAAELEGKAKGKAEELRSGQ